MSNRDKGSIYSSVQYQQEYEGADEIKDKIMKNLTTGTIRMDRQPRRMIGEGFGGYIPRSQSNATMSVIDDDKASSYKIKGSKLGLDRLNKFKPRDLMMYT